MTDVTLILSRIEHGDAEAAAQLLPLVHENPGQTLQATALVHEAYLRLVGGKNAWDSRGHFFAAAAESMRRILVENARRKKRLKHGGDLKREQVDELPIIVPEIHEDLVELDAALDRLKTVDPQAVELVNLRYFAGLSNAEASKILGISPRSGDRVWAFARAWLHQAISGENLAGAADSEKK